MNRILAAAATASALVAGAPAYAAPVSHWDYRVTTEWLDASFTPGGGSARQTGSLISWGASGGDHLDSTRTAANSRSAVEITDATATGTVVTNGAAAPTSTITHYNNAILSSFAALSEARLATTLTLTPGTPSSAPPPAPLSTEFAVRFVETPNQTPCGFDGTTVCDDIFVVTFGALAFSFDYEGTTYAVNIIETASSLFGLSDAACALAGALPGCVGFQTAERAFTPATFAFDIRALALPEPGLLALIGLGLLGMAAFRRDPA